jgi:hypothetical protein
VIAAALIPSYSLEARTLVDEGRGNVINFDPLRSLIPSEFKEPE